MRKGLSGSHAWLSNRSNAGRHFTAQTQWPRALSIVSIVALTIGCITLSGVSASAEGPEIQDSNLLAAVNSSIDVNRPADTPITSAEATSLTSIGGLNEITGVTTLAGLEAFTSLTSFHATGTFTDASPLTQIPTLQSLRLFSSGLAGQLPHMSAPLQVLEVQSGDFASLTDITRAVTEPEELLVLGLKDTPVPHLAGIERFPNLNQLDLGGARTGVFDGGQHEWAHKSPISDLSPLQGHQLVVLNFSNSSAADISPVSSTPVLMGDRNLVSDISSVTATWWAFADQVIELDQAKVGELIENPLRDINGETVAVTSSSAGFVREAEGNWSFSTPGHKTLEFSVTDEAVDLNSIFAISYPWVKWGEFSGTINIYVEETVTPGKQMTTAGEPKALDHPAAHVSDITPVEAHETARAFADANVRNDPNPLEPVRHQAGDSSKLAQTGGAAKSHLLAVMATLGLVGIGLVTAHTILGRHHPK